MRVVTLVPRLRYVAVLVLEDTSPYDASSPEWLSSKKGARSLWGGDFEFGEFNTLNHSDIRRRNQQRPSRDEVHALYVCGKSGKRPHAERPASQPLKWSRRIFA